MRSTAANPQARAKNQPEPEGRTEAVSRDLSAAPSNWRLFNLFGRGSEGEKNEPAPAPITLFEHAPLNGAIFQKRLARAGAETDGPVTRALTSHFWSPEFGSPPAKENFLPLTDSNFGEVSPNDQERLVLLQESSTLEFWSLRSIFEKKGLAFPFIEDWYDDRLLADGADLLGSEFEPLVSRALGEPASPEALSRFAERIFRTKSAASLELLSSALGLDAVLPAKLLLGWKAVIAQEEAMLESLTRAASVRDSIQNARVMTSAESLLPSAASAMQEALLDHLNSVAGAIVTFCKAYGAEPRRARAFAGESSALGAYLSALCDALPAVGRDFAELERVLGLWAFASNRRSSELFPPELFATCHASILGEDHAKAGAAASKRS